MGYVKKTGLCGIWVEITTQVTATEVEIDVEGGPGNRNGLFHSWTNLEVLVKARDTSTGTWVTKFNVNQSGKTWSGSFAKTGYSVYKVTAKGYDSYEEGHRGRVVAEIEEAIAMGVAGA